MSDQEKADVIVVGAGLSGLVCGRELVDAGARVDLLEARDRVGGRILTRDVAGTMTDFGGQWVAPSQRRILDLAAELGVERYSQFREGTSLVVRGNQRRSFLSRIPFLQTLELLFRVKQIERLSKQVPAEAPTRAKKAARWDRQTLAEWLERVRTAEARDMISVITELKFAAEPDELSFLHFLHYLRTSGGLIDHEEFSSGAQEEGFVGGAQQLASKLVDRAGGSLHLDEPVTAIEQESDGVVVHSGKRNYRAEFVVLALSPALAEGIDVKPAFPKGRAHLQKASRPGSVIKCVVGYDSPFWRTAGFSGEAYSITGNLRAVVDDCAPDGSRPALAAFIVGAAARNLSTVDYAERRDIVIGELAGLFGDIATTPTTYADFDWLSDEWSKGCVAVLGPGVLSECEGALRTPIGRIHFAGTEAATEWPSHLEGAVESGQRAARELLARLG